MKILLFGARGQLGRELHRSLAILGTITAVTRDDVDLVDPQRLAETIRTHAPDLIVNAAAYTAVDQAESEPLLAAAINHEAVAVMAQEAVRIGARMIHYSTDYVFAGDSEQPYQTDDMPSPRSVYGKTKLDGERAVLGAAGPCIVFRTSWVYSMYGANFAKTMIRLAQERDGLRVVADQIGAPTAAELIADVSAIAVRDWQSDDAMNGVYHLTAGGETSWHGFAQYLIGRAHELGVPLRTTAGCIEQIPTSEYPTPAERPANSRLDNSRLEATLCIRMPDWRLHADRVVNQLIDPVRY